MVSDTEDPQAAAERLEVALERIAQAAARESPQPIGPAADAPTGEIAARLDDLIGRLRMALGHRQD